MSAELKLSVKQLVDFSCRSGDLGYGSRQGPSALEGIRAHQKLQQQLRPEFDAEVSISTTIELEDYQLTLGGRVDLLKASEVPATIAEIKSCYGEPGKLAPEQTALHWAQLKLYGFCYLQQHPAPGIRLRMLWYDLLQNQCHEETTEFDYAQLQAFCHQAAANYLRWHQLISKLNRDGRHSAKNLEFPFANFRPGQRSMAAAAYRCLRDAGHVLCEAPTGIGKTVSALFPALRALGDDHIDKVVYLTAKTSGRQMARDTVSAMRDNGLQSSVLVIQAKSKACACLNGSYDLGPQGRCPMGLGFFDRLPAAREQLITGGDMSTGVIARVALQHQLCAFELSLQMLPWANVVICDYNYVFDPLVALGYFRDTSDRIALLVDEVHNLVDRARQMYSAQLIRSQGQLAAANCKTSNPQLARHIAGISRALERWQRSQDSAETITNTPPSTIDRALDRLLDHIARQSQDEPGPPPELGDWFKEIYRYRHIAELFGDHHRCISRSQQQGKFRDITVRLQCLNANDALGDSYKLFHGVLLFSATLRPMVFYRDALGLPATTSALSLPSPFTPGHQASLVCTGIDTRYQQRQQSIAPIVELIVQSYSARPGNYLVFFPSYQYLQQVANHLLERHPELALVCQQRNSSEQARSEFLQQFDGSQNTLGFAIMGGIYGEGVDYQGDSLIGAIVIGVGLPAMDTEQELIRRDFEHNHLDGFDFAYRYPGISRVLQAAGRVIRSESDRGVVVLVDQRFGQAAYRELLPEHWQLQLCGDVQKLDSALHSFWRSRQSH